MQAQLTGRAATLAREPVHIDRRGGCRLLAALEESEAALRRRAEAVLAETEAGRPPAPAAAWLLDNYSFLRSQLRELRDAMPRAYYRGLPRLSAGPHRGDPLVYHLALSIAEEAGGQVSLEAARGSCEEFQRIASLTLAELWALGPMLKLVLLSEVCRVAGGEPLDTPAAESALRDAITALRGLETASWKDFVESLSVVDRILREDPAGVYAGMEFETRDAYRHAVEGVACRSPLNEEQVAALAVRLAREAAASAQPDARRAHVGFYFSGEGLSRLRREAGHRIPMFAGLRQLLYRMPGIFYLGGTALLTALLLAAVWKVAAAPWWLLALLAVPASQAAVAVMNPLVTLLLPPRRLPRLDFSEGIPEGCRTFVVVPTLLLSRGNIEKLLENLEIHYLANRDPNLLFALLTDYPDAPQPEGPQDHLLELCAQGIRRLNERHAGESRAPFYLFHRGRRWNPAEGVWMGYERKRGKLSDFNALLLGEADVFDLKIGDLSMLGTVRYVITLDSDTQLPRDTARKLIATMAHPLNRPVLDPATRTVREGYALMQPRVSISMESAGRCRLARIFSGQTGFDPYTTAVSDVYQDLWGRASFTGKGIYDLEIFHRALEGRFPENALLSHDLIEGEHVRTGLVTDLEVLDDYPGSYVAWAKRKHRWVRGDWQIALWVLPWAPAAGWRWIRNPLPLVSRWKILDNLRRSLIEISCAAALVASWLWLPEMADRATLAGLALLVLPVYTDLLLACLRLPQRRFLRSYLITCAVHFGRGHYEALFTLVFLGHQALAMADAIGRTVVRRLVTRRKLLEWETAAQAEARSGSRRNLMSLYLAAAPVLGFATALWLAAAGQPAGSLAVLILDLWIVAPLAAEWMNGMPRERPARAADRDFLRDLALQSWRYFRDFSGPEHNWLIPDNVQEDPPAVAARTSPTNIGLLLNATVTAHDFGYLGRRELSARLGGTLRSLRALERHRGHWLNWYDTRTLATLEPRFVSTVDSGNLEAALLTAKQGCLALLKEPVIEPRVLEGLRDYCLRLRNALPGGARSGAIMRLIAALLRQLEYRPTDLFFWEGVLTETSRMVARLCEHVDWECARLEHRGASEAREARYWREALEARMAECLAELYGLAPWLAEPYESELRLRAADPTLADLMAALCRVPEFGDLPVQYERVELAIRRRMESGEPLAPALRSALEGLLAALDPARRETVALVVEFEAQATAAASLAREMDFAFLFDRRRKLLRIGYHVGAGALDESYYDLLASEARTAVFLAIAKGELPREAWFHLGRKLTTHLGYRSLLSWSGTLFEYLMPCLWLKVYEHTLLGESLRTAVRIQQAYGRERRIPWGVSEAAYAARDSALNYQYQAFGIPGLAVNPRVAGNVVVAPYASVLALLADRAAATENLRGMAARGWLGAYGFYESVDFSAGHRHPALVRAFMAHHVGMSLLALANVLLDGIVQKRFHAEPQVLATEFLLQERVPAMVDEKPEERLPAAAAALLPPPELDRRQAFG